jgi:hypothetical protein
MDGSRNEPSRRRGVDGDGEDRVGGVAAAEEATRFRDGDEGRAGVRVSCFCK